MVLLLHTLKYHTLVRDITRAEKGYTSQYIKGPRVVKQPKKKNPKKPPCYFENCKGLPSSCFCRSNYIYGNMEYVLWVYNNDIKQDKVWTLSFNEIKITQGKSYLLNNWLYLRIHSSYLNQSSVIILNKSCYSPTRHTGGKDINLATCPVFSKKKPSRAHIMVPVRVLFWRPHSFGRNCSI